MRVIKLGGSLASTSFLKDWLDTIVGLKSIGLVIVPGGGVFSDQVRRCQKKWKFDDRTAHKMALLGMHQFGLMLASFRAELQIAVTVQDIPPVLANNRVAVWMPEVCELDQAGIASGWEITSDSLSAWLAGQIGAQQLVIVKSSPRSGLLSDPQVLAQRGILDTAFLETWKKSGVDLKIVHSSEHCAFSMEFNAAYSVGQSSEICDYAKSVR